MEHTPVFSPWIDASDFDSVTRALQFGWISGTSPIIKEFENEISNLSGRKFVAAVANGSVALDLAFGALKLKAGDEVVLPNFTIISCLAAIVRTGATPILVDVDPKTWNMRLEDVVNAVTPKTRAVLVVHTYGLPAPIDLISEFCKEKGIYLIEDAAEAHGIKIDGRQCGSFGDISTFSFYANKHVTTGEGGAVCTNSEIFSDYAFKMRNLAFGSGPNRFEHENFGWNYRMSGLSAALGLSQLQKLSKIIDSKKAQGAHYNRLLGDAGDRFQLPQLSANGSENNYWVYGIVCKDENLKSSVVQALGENGVETRPFFYPLSDQPVYKGLNLASTNNFENSSHLGRCGIYLPTGSHITETKQIEISEIVLRTSNH